MGDKLKVMTVFGTRPEATKMAPLVKALERCPDIDGICCVTAQHRQMLDSVLDIFAIKPDYDLDVMAPRQTLDGLTCKVLERLQPVLREAKPDMVLVHGDTTTTFAAALSAFYAQIPVGHVEAGLRTFNKYAPYPEEMNRLLTTRIADLYFCPTTQNRDHLRAEGITQNVFITGNTAIDALPYTVREHYVYKTPALHALDSNKRLLLVTAHRRENLGAPMADIMRALRLVLDAHPDTELVYPVHLNPVVQQAAREGLGDHPRAHLIDPIDVDDMHNLMARCYLVLTDSGGLQEEAPSLGKPVLVLRNETERQEAVAAGTVLMAGTDTERIVMLANSLLDDSEKYQAMARSINPYGDGKASQRIVQAILHVTGRGPAPVEFAS